MQRNKTHKLPSFCSPSIPAAMVICFGDCSFAWGSSSLLWFGGGTAVSVLTLFAWCAWGLSSLPCLNLRRVVVVGGMDSLQSLHIGFFSLVSSVLCILLILMKASFFSVPKQNAVWMPGFSHTGNLHLMFQFSSLSCLNNLQSVVGRRMSLPVSHWGFLVFLFVSVLCIFATHESVLSTKENAVQTLAWNWHAICGFLHCYILFTILGTCIQCVQMTPSCTSSSFQLTGSVLYFVCFLFFPPSVESRVWLTTKVFLFVVFLSVVVP